MTERYSGYKIVIAQSFNDGVEVSEDVGIGDIQDDSTTNLSLGDGHWRAAPADFASI